MLKRTTRLSALLLALVMVLSVVMAVPRLTYAADGGFKDVEEGDTFYKYITRVDEREFYNGDEHGNFNAEDPMTRAQVAKVLVNALDLDVDEDVRPTEPPFPDVPANHQLAAFVKAAKDAGIFEGDKDGNFNPEATITRGQAAAVVVRTLGFELVEGYERVLTDVEGHEFEEDIDILLSQDVVEGFEGKFNPERAVTRGEFAKYLVNAVTFQEADKAVAALAAVLANPDSTQGDKDEAFEAAEAARDALLEDDKKENVTAAIDELIPVVVVVSISAIDATTIEVTLSDGSTVTQKLDTPLKDGVRTLVTIEYDGVTRAVTWTADAPAAEDLEEAQAELEEAQADLEDAKADSKEKMVARISANKALDQANLDLEHAQKYGTEEEQQEAQAKVDEAQKAAEKAIEESNKAEEALEEAQEKVDALENEITGLEAEVAVEKAEASFEQDDVDAAQKLVNVLAGPASAKITPLQNRLDAVNDTIAKIKNAQEWINDLPEAKDVTLVHKEQIEHARGLVDILPEAAQDKLEHVDFLEAAEDVLAKLVDEKAIADAEIRVKAAEDKKTQDAVDNAKDWVAKVEDEEAKKAFEDRLEAVQNAIDEAAAEARVRNAENKKTQPAIDNAQELIDELDDGDVKDALQARLDKVQKELNEAAAEAKVGAAEYYINTKDFIAAKTLYDEAVELVKALDEGEVKTDLLERLAEVEEAIAQAEVEAMIESITLKDLRANPTSIWSVTIYRAVPFKDNVESVKVRILEGERVLAENIAKEKLLTSDSTGELTSPFKIGEPAQSDSWEYGYVLAGEADTVEVELVIDGVSYIVTK